MRELSSYVLGIDPGLSGAIALVAPDGSLVAVADVTDDGKPNKRVNAVELNAVIKHWCDEYWVTQAVIEDVHAMPKQGVSSTFKFGRAAGTLEGLAAGQGLAVAFLSPNRWKAATGLSGAGKDAARVDAQRRWPDQRELFKQKLKGQARADAALIALAWIEGAR